VAPIGILLACTLAATAGSAAAVALVAVDRGGKAPTCFAQSGSARMLNGSGYVVAADLDKRYLTIRHRELKSLDMPEMDMMFEVQDRAKMAGLRPKDRIRFTIDRSDMTITNIMVVGPGD
jgi:Cu/Ag efflux protein CusF